MPNNIDDLRTHLFETLAALRDKEKPMELDRARTVAQIAKVIVESAKVEVEFLGVTGAARSTGFLPEGEVLVKPGRRFLTEKNGPTASVIPPGEQCMLCHCRLTAQYNIERGLCGSCADRPEAKNLVRKPA